MAVVTTTITPVEFNFPFSGYTEPLAEASGIARGETRFSAPSTTIAATGAGDNQKIECTISLSNSFAWVLVDLSLFLQNEAAAGDNNFNDGIQCFLADGPSTSNRTLVHHVGLQASSQSSSGNTGKGGQVYRMFAPYQGLLVSPTGQSPELFFGAFNKTANDTAYVAVFNARFLKYDVAQANNVRVNSAMPVR